MESTNAALPVIVKSGDLSVKQEQPKNKFIVMEQTPDKYEPQISLKGNAAAAVTSVAAGKTVYEFGKKAIDKAFSWIEKENNQRLIDLGKHPIEIPKNIKVNCKYAAAIAASLATIGIIFKDSDKDGKLDIFEAAQKFLVPEC